MRGKIPHNLRAKLYHAWLRTEEGQSCQGRSKTRAAPQGKANWRLRMTARQAETSSKGGPGPQGPRKANRATRDSHQVQLKAQITRQDHRPEAGPRSIVEEQRSAQGYSQSQTRQNLNAALGAGARRCVGGGPRQSW